MTSKLFKEEFEKALAKARAEARKEAVVRSKTASMAAVESAVRQLSDGIVDYDIYEDGFSVERAEKRRHMSERAEKARRIKELCARSDELIKKEKARRIKELCARSDELIKKAQSLEDEAARLNDEATDLAFELKYSELED